MQQGFKLLGEFAKSAGLLGELAHRRIKYWILKTAANCSLRFLTAHHGFSSRLVTIAAFLHREGESRSVGVGVSCRLLASSVSAFFGCFARSSKPWRHGEAQKKRDFALNATAAGPALLVGLVVVSARISRRPGNTRRPPTARGICPHALSMIQLKRAFAPWVCDSWSSDRMN
jgi:hypothetical protein